MACVAESYGDGAQLIVRNTFLELFDEAPFEPARPRVVSDMTDHRLPHKVQYDDVRPGSGACKASMPAASVPLMPVSEAYAQTPWTSPMDMQTAMGVMDMPSITVASGPGTYLSYPAMSQPQCQASSRNYSAYQGTGNFAPAISQLFASAAAQENLRSSTLPKVPQRTKGLLNKHAALRDPQNNKLSKDSVAACRQRPCHDVDTTAQTTVMLRNIPNRYTQGHLVDLLAENGFRSCFNFVYLPMDFRNGVNLGYAFVNLVTHNEAMRAMNVFQSFSAWYYESNKVCEVSWAHPHQGLEEHVERYRNSPVMHQSMPDDYKPMLFHNGVRIPFLPPTKAIRAPKLRPVRDEKCIRGGQMS